MPHVPCRRLIPSPLLFSCGRCGKGATNDKQQCKRAHPQTCPPHPPPFAAQSQSRSGSRTCDAPLLRTIPPPPSLPVRPHHPSIPQTTRNHNSSLSHSHAPVFAAAIVAFEVTIPTPHPRSPIPRSQPLQFPCKPYLLLCTHCVYLPLFLKKAAPPPHPSPPPLFAYLLSSFFKKENGCVVARKPPHASLSFTPHLHTGPVHKEDSLVL